MEGLIPCVYRAIMEYKYKNGSEKQNLLGSWLNDSPSSSYIRLPHDDSGRFQSASDFQLFRSDYGFSSSTSPSSTSQRRLTSSGSVHSPIRRRLTA